MQTPAIQVQDLTKEFDGVPALLGVSFSVQAGSITALLGGNGAGKTTTLSILLGLLHPTRGSANVLGFDMLRQPQGALPLMNFSSPYVDLPARLSVREILNIYSHLYGIRQAKEEIARLMEDLDLTGSQNKLYGQLSAGQKTRAQLAKSLINRPRLLLLDEPTASLDPDTAHWVREYLMNYQKREGATLFLASHNMQEVERMCDAVLVMKRGRMVASGTPAELLANYGRANLEEVFLDIARGESHHAA